MKFCKRAWPLEISWHDLIHLMARLLEGFLRTWHVHFLSWHICAQKPWLWHVVLYRGTKVGIFKLFWPLQKASCDISSSINTSHKFSHSTLTKTLPKFFPTLLQPSKFIPFTLIFTQTIITITYTHQFNKSTINSPQIIPNPNFSKFQISPILHQSYPTKT